jgi:hypothetical protein
MLVEIRSRRWNFVIGALGVVYAITALVLLIFHLVQTWGAVSLIDRAIQIALVMAVAVSIWFILVAARGLGIQLHRRSGTRVTSPA